MFEAVPQELKESVEKALRKASRDVFEVLELTELVEVLAGRASETLEKWADELSTEPGGTQNKPLTPQEKYQYLIDAGSEEEKQLYSQEHVKSYLLNTPDVLDALFEMHSWDWSKKQ
jgi:hypothetical protein